MQLEVLPDHRSRQIIVGTSVRKPLVILKAYLDSLASQELPVRTHLRFVFVADFTPEQKDAEDYLRAWVKERDGEVLRGQPSPIGDFREGPMTHEWTLSSMQRVGQNKNKILKRTLDLKADAVWFVDADLILDRTTLSSLMACEKPMVTAVYWTVWSKAVNETQPPHAGPQVWLRHPYQLDGRGMDEAEFRQHLINRELTRVWGFGACTLIQRFILEAGVDFSPAPDVPQVGLMAGEDRQFCITAERKHLDAWADPWPDAFHIYHASDDVPQIPGFVERLGMAHPDRAVLGDLVSLRLLAMEPVPQGPNWAHQPPQYVRGRLGSLPLMPELEEAIYGLHRGEKAVVRIHCPIHHPMPYLRGRSRLIEVTLIDCKPFQASPVIERELYISPQSKRVTDGLALTVEQQHLTEERTLELVR